MTNDRFGKLISPGAKVTWPTRVGSFLEVVDGIVTEIKFTENKTVWDYKTRTEVPVEVYRITVASKDSFSGKTIVRWTEQLERVTVVEEVKVTVKQL